MSGRLLQPASTSREHGGPCRHDGLVAAAVEAQAAVPEAATVADGHEGIAPVGQGAVGTVVPEADVGGAKPRPTVAAVPSTSGNGRRSSACEPHATNDSSAAP